MPDPRKYVCECARQFRASVMDANPTVDWPEDVDTEFGYLCHALDALAKSEAAFDPHVGETPNDD